MHMRGFVLLIVTLGFAGNVVAKDDAATWSDARQMIVVTTADWNADHGTLRSFEREGDGWREVGTVTPVTVGKAGAAWGLGLGAGRGDGPRKREGDNRRPAGVFRIGTAFGYAPSANTALPYRALSASDWCMDVSGAAHYNRIVDADVVGAAAVKGSSEPMRRGRRRSPARCSRSARSGSTRCR